LGGFNQKTLPGKKMSNAPIPTKKKNCQQAGEKHKPPKGTPRSGAPPNTTKNQKPSKPPNPEKKERNPRVFGSPSPCDFGWGVKARKTKE